MCDQDGALAHTRGVCAGLWGLFPPVAEREREGEREAFYIRREGKSNHQPELMNGFDRSFFPFPFGLPIAHSMTITTAPPGKPPLLLLLLVHLAVN